MKYILKMTGLMLITACFFSACKKDIDPVFVITASGGSNLQLNGIAGNEAGSSAGNSVFLDFSTDKQTAVLRSSWDLGFYCGSDFRVIINNTSGAMVKQLSNRSSLSEVVAADTAGVNLGFSFSATDYNYIDDVRGDLTKTAIAAISATDENNKVYVLNSGTSGSIAARNWYKIKVTRNNAGGYNLQYAGLEPGSPVKTLSIAKNADYNFKYVHLTNGTTDAEPARDLWDIRWSYQVWETPFGAGSVPYPFSDFIVLNKPGNVQAAEVLTSTVSYDAYAAANIASTIFSSNADVIGGNWRSTQPATGVKTDRFYVVKDHAGNVYKIKFLAMGLNDGGVRGKPQLTYQLVK